MAQRTPITIRLESFEGPLDLLLYLIQTHEFDISRISIGAITDQFVAYVRLMQELNFDVASDFLVMAATMLHWKSKALLPQENKAADTSVEIEAGLTQEELIRQLLEHQRFLAAGKDLSQLSYLGEDVFVRPNRKPPIEKIWKELDITNLATSYQDIIIRARKRTTILKKETVSLTDKIADFADRLEVGVPRNIRDLLSVIGTDSELVVTFLASLELSRLRKSRLHQEGVYQDIFLELMVSLRGFDMNMARGFDNPIAQTEAALATAPASLAESKIEIPEVDLSVLNTSLTSPSIEAGVSL